MTYRWMLHKSQKLARASVDCQRRCNRHRPHSNLGDLAPMP
ncbi:hypothetical protein ACQUJT_20150 [Ralstonia pseudosolanacearum]